MTDYPKYMLFHNEFQDCNMITKEQLQDFKLSNDHRLFRLDENKNWCMLTLCINDSKLILIWRPVIGDHQLDELYENSYKNILLDVDPSVKQETTEELIPLGHE